MTVRPFDWRDLLALHRHRYQSVFLDSALVLTRGPMLIPGALLSYLAHATGIFTCVFNGKVVGDESVMGQFIHAPGSQLAHLTFLTPATALESAAVYTLLDYMVSLSGDRGALRLLADVDERSPAFDTLRRCGYAVYTHQRIWQLPRQSSGSPRPIAWRAATSRDTIAIRSLYNNLVPGLVQQAEPFATQRPRGVVSYQGGELLAYVEFKYGHRGIWVQPFVHPDAKDVPDCFIDLLDKVPNRLSRPVNVCVRSYQSWLEPSIEELGAQTGERQAVMVKNLATLQKAGRAFPLPRIEGGQPGVTAPFVRSENK